MRSCCGSTGSTERLCRAVVRVGPERSLLQGGEPSAMSYIKSMFAAHPVRPSSDQAVAIECITACYSCAEACNACADACLGEENVKHQVTCIRLDLDCGEICLATAKIVSRLTATDK